MANIVILTHTNKYSYHAEVSSMIHAALQKIRNNVDVVDIDSCKFDHECLAKIKELQPDVIVTLDLAGFRFRTQSGENALNMLPTKNMNLVWGNKPEYATFLNKKISLSMIFYDATGVDHGLSASYPNMLYYKAICEVTEEPKSFQRIWDDFVKEIS